MSDKLPRSFYKRDDVSSIKKLANYLMNGFNTTVDIKQKDKMIGSKEVYTCPYCLRETETSASSSLASPGVA